MGKLQLFAAVFEGNNEVFKPGDTINGNIRIVLSGEKGDIRGIKVMCKGKSYTHWTESRGSGNNRRTIHYTWKIPFFKQELILRGAGKNNKAASRMKLPIGDHRFPFQFQLPAQSLPPPFEGKWGWVRYYIKATIDRPWKFDHKMQRFFSIWTTKDLNMIPNILKVPVGICEKTVCCLCCESGPIHIRGSIDKSGYAPGENILVTVELNNQCGRELVSLRATLFQKSIYRAKHGSSTHTRKNTKMICGIEFENCNAQESILYERRPLAIPPIAPNSFENCPNIEIIYSVKIEADVSGTPIDAKMELPIVIGTVPALPHLVQQSTPQSGYGAQYQTSYSPYGQQPLATGGSQVGYPQPQNQYNPTPTGLELPPPSYEMAVEGPIQIQGKQGTFGTTSYAPRYPYYNPGLVTPPIHPSGEMPIMSQPGPSHQFPTQTDEIQLKVYP